MGVGVGGGEGDWPAASVGSKQRSLPVAGAAWHGAPGLGFRGRAAPSWSSHRPPTPPLSQTGILPGPL